MEDLSPDTSSSSTTLGAASGHGGCSTQREPTVQSFGQDQACCARRAKGASVFHRERYGPGIGITSHMGLRHMIGTTREAGLGHLPLEAS